FQCLPLPTDWIPAHTQFDTFILACQILFQMHSDMVFQDSTFTNGLTVSSTIIKPLKKPKFKKCKHVDAKEFQYIHKPPKHMLRQIADRCTLVDLNQQGLLYCMHELSSSKHCCIYWYTHKQKTKELHTTRYQKI
ncbi:hypothetical protein BX070DRAFT_188337, partial [Coemansia spiralis]